MGVPIENAWDFEGGLGDCVVCVGPEQEIFPYVILTILIASFRNILASHLDNFSSGFRWKYVLSLSSGFQH